MSAEKKPYRVLVFVPGLIPSVIIGILRPLVELEKRGKVQLRLRYSSIHAGAANDITWCDIGVFCRNSEIADLAYLYQLKRAAKGIIYEIDDNFEEIPLNTRIGIYHRKYHRLHALKRFYSMADLTRVYSERLRERAESHGANVWVVKSYFDDALIQHLSPPSKDAKIKIAYPTGRIDDPRLERMFFGALRHILIKYSEKVEIHFWRKKIPEPLDGLNGVVLNQSVSSYEAFIETFYSKGFDIGLAPLVDEPFFHSKSNNKYREFGGCGIAGIYSDIRPYSDCILNEETGLLVANTVQSWIDGIERLILDSNLRQVIALNARKDVALNYSFESAVESFIQSLNEVSKKSHKECNWLYPSRLRLQCVFVGPSTNTSIVDVPDQVDRWGSFEQSLCRVGCHSLHRMGYVDVLEHAHIIASSNVVLYVINTIAELQQAAISFSLCRSVILDLSQLRSNVEEFRSAFENSNVSIPISLLLNRDQHSLIQMANDMRISFHRVDPAITPMEDEYSLCGYKAAYIDLVERHRRYGKIKHVSRTRAVLRNFSNNISSDWDLYVGRAKRAWALLQWRLGRRPL